MILQLLRDGTASLHQLVEQAVDIPGHLGSVPAYTAMLAQFHGFYAPLEERLTGIGGFESAGLDIAGRCKAPLIRDDLRVLGHSPEAVTALPVCPDLPAVDTLAEALGCLYVLEGSTLGGQFISRQVHRALGMTPETGGRFFHGYGDKTGEMWQTFRAAVTGFVVSPADQDAAVAAAKDTFQKLHRWIAARKDSA